MQIRSENLNDSPFIEELTLAAFKDHPHQDPEKGITEHLIIRNLRASDALTLSLVAEHNSNIIGHIAFSPILIDGDNLQWFILAPVSVHPDYQNQGIGSSLINEGLRQLKTLSAHGCVVLGEPDYYSRFGFHTNHNLTVDGIPPEYFMAQIFNDATPSGNVQFHDGFNV